MWSLPPHRELWGCRATLSFPIVKLRNYTERWPDLEASNSPFVIVVMSHLKRCARAAIEIGDSSMDPEADRC